MRKVLSLALSFSLSLPVALCFELLALYRGQFLCLIGLRQLPYLEKSVLNIVTNIPETSHVSLKSSQVNTLPKAKSQAKDKRAKDRQ
jgi:hypothetical protein